MSKRKHFSINPTDLAAINALSALHPEYEDEDYEEDNSPITLKEAAAMWKATGKEEGYRFGYTEEELNDALNE